MDPSKRNSPPPPYGTVQGPPGGLPYPTQSGAPYPPQQIGQPMGYPLQQPGQPMGYPPQQPGQPPYPPQSGFPASGAMMGQQSMIGNILRGGYDSDAEGGNGDEGISPASFGSKAIRRGFIRKVYSILTMQLLVTCAIIALFMTIEPLKLAVLRRPYLVYVAMAITFACIIIMSCFDTVRRKFPVNFIFLGVYTIAQGFMLGVLTARFDTEAVLMAAGICAAVTFSLTIFAFQTKYDFTTCGGILCAALVILVFAGVLMIFFPYNKYVMIGYGCGGALIFSLYLVYDTQMMMGGNHKNSISPEEYIFAALSIYIDIIQLFVYILTIIGAARSD